MPWLFALGSIIALVVTNLFSVSKYGEFEFWFASIKVAAIVLFLLFGVAAILGLVPGVPAPGLDNLTGNGGFMPNGPGAVLAGILVVVFSFFGAEIATIAAGESENPVDAVKKAVKSTVWRILVFYIGSIAIVVTLLPWNSASVAKSPYVAVIELFGIPGAGTIMDIVVLTSVLSCLNSGLYTASRMLFSLSRRGDAPRSWMRISQRGVPAAAVLASTVVGFITVGLNYAAPDTVFLFLVNTSGAIALFVWLVISVSQLILRRRMGTAAPGSGAEDVALPLPDLDRDRQHRCPADRHGDTRLHPRIAAALPGPRRRRGRDWDLALPRPRRRGSRPGDGRRTPGRRCRRPGQPAAAAAARSQTEEDQEAAVGVGRE